MRGLLLITIPLSLFLIYASYNPTLIQGPETAGKSFYGEGALLDPVNVTSIIGGIFVFVFYWLKFARWPGPEGAPAGFKPLPTRHFTTWLRYVGWSFVYSSAMMICYFMIILFPQTVINIFHILLTPDVTKHMNGVDAGILGSILPYLEESEGRLDPTIIVPYAIILVTLAWSSGFAKWEQSFRRTLQESALIPSEAQRLIQYFEDEPERFKPKKKQIKRVLERFPNRLLVEEDFKDKNHRLLLKYAQCEYLIERVRRLSGTRSFARIINRYKNDLDEVKEKANGLRDQLRLHREEIINDLRGAFSRFSGTDSMAVVGSDFPTLQKAGNVDEVWNDSQAYIPFARLYINRSEVQLEGEIDACLDKSLQKDHLKEIKKDISNMGHCLEDYQEKIKAKMRGTLPVKPKMPKPTFEKSDLDGPIAMRDVYQFWKICESTAGFEPRYHNQAKEQLEVLADDCLHSILQIVVCGVLAVGKSPRQRHMLLKKIGLKMPQDIGPSFGREEAVRSVLSIGSVMFLCTGAFFLVSSLLGLSDASKKIDLNGMSVSMGFGTIFMWIIYAMQMHILGLIGGYLIQKSINANQLEEEDEDEDEDEEDDQDEKDPVREKVFIADYAECFIFGFCLNIILFVLLTLPLGEWNQFRTGWPWAFVPAVTAGFTGYYVSPACKLKQVKWMLAIFQGLITSLVSFLIFLSIYNYDFILQPGDHKPLTVFCFYCVLTSFLIGSALSYNLQRWARYQEEDKSPEKVNIEAEVQMA